MSIQIILILIGYYLYGSLCLWGIAKRLGHQSAWMAWLPLFDLILCFRLAGRSSWEVAAFLFVPYGGILLTAAWMKIAERRGQSRALGYMCLVPVFNIFPLACLALMPRTVEASRTK